MPGMLDTVLNLGLNAESVEALSETSRNPLLPGTRIGGSCRCTRMWSGAFR